MYIAAREGVWWTRTITASFAGLFTLREGVWWTRTITASFAGLFTLWVAREGVTGTRIKTASLFGREGKCISQNQHTKNTQPLCTNIWLPYLFVFLSVRGRWRAWLIVGRVVRCGEVTGYRHGDLACVGLVTACSMHVHVWRNKEIRVRSQQVYKGQCTRYRDSLEA